MGHPLLGQLQFAVGSSFWPAELLSGCCRRCKCHWCPPKVVATSPCRVGTTAQFQCYKLRRRRRLPSTRGAHGVCAISWHAENNANCIQQLLSLWSHPSCPCGPLFLPSSPFAGIRWYDKSTGSWFGD